MWKAKCESFYTITSGPALIHSVPGLTVLQSFGISSIGDLAFCDENGLVSVHLIIIIRRDSFSWYIYYLSDRKIILSWVL